MRAVGSYLYLAALAMLVGGGSLYTFVLTPAIFSAYPRDAAGGIVGTMMPHYFAFQLGALAVALVALAAVGRPWPRFRRNLCLALLLCALAVQGYVHLRLYPQILAVKSQVASFESAPGSPERARFRTLHGISMLLNLLIVADGALLLALVPPGGPRRFDLPSRPHEG